MAIRVLVVEDSLTVRKRIVEVLESDPEIEVIGEAHDGGSAIELTKRLRPDVITLDIVLPGMSGLEVTEQLMAFHPTPILIVSASMNRGEVFQTCDALAAGAVDVLDKPRGTEPDEGWEIQLVRTVKLVSRIKVVTHPRAKLGPRRSASPTAPEALAEHRLIAIGASTGGPAALQFILQSLPSGFPLPVLLVIHIGQAFAPGLVEWLRAQSKLEVRLARDGEAIPPPGRGVVLVAPPAKHLAIASGRCRLIDGPERHSCRPSVDVLFESVAEQIGSGAIGCLLTGMGVDGADGLLRMRRAGALTIAQDETSSVVFGMPGAAVKLGAAELVLPLSEIPQTFVRNAANERKRA